MDAIHILVLIAALGIILCGVRVLYCGHRHLGGPERRHRERRAGERRLA